MVGAFFSATFIASLREYFLSGIISWRYLFFFPAVLGAMNLVLVLWLFDFKSTRQYDYEVSYVKVLKEKIVIVSAKVIKK